MLASIDLIRHGETERTPAMRSIPQQPSDHGPPTNSPIAHLSGSAPFSFPFAAYRMTRRLVTNPDSDLSLAISPMTWALPINGLGLAHLLRVTLAVPT